VTRPLRLAPASPADAGAVALDALAAALLPRLRALLAVDAQGAELVDVVRIVPSSRRSLMVACRSGEIPGAVKVARRWCAPRASVDAFLMARGPRVVPKTQADDDDLEETRRLLAAPGRRRRSA